jgi:L-fucose mutarotase/ribose pyranase (RbsD/FucU family)
MTLLTGLISFDKSNFPSMLRESMQSGIRSVLGESVLQAVRSLLPLDDCVQRPDEFHHKLSPIFGDRGAETLEKMVVKDLFRKLNLSIIDRTSFDFEGCVNQARIRLANENRGPVR